MHKAMIKEPYLQVLERNPEFNQMLNNPEVLRESMRLAANPVSLHRTRTS